MTASGENGSESLAQYRACRLHVNAELVEICTTHQVLLCRLCSHSMHPSCSKISIKDIVENSDQKSCFKSLPPLFTTLEQELRALRNKQKFEKEKMMEDIRLCRIKVMQTREKINCHFDKIEGELKSSLDILERELENKFDTELTASKHSIGQIAKEMTILERCFTSNDDNSMFIQYCRSKQVYHELTREHDNINAALTENLRTDIFIDEQIEELSLAIKKVGRVICRQVLETPCGGGFQHIRVDGVFLDDGSLVLHTYETMTLLFVAANGRRISELKLTENMYRIAVATRDSVVGTVPSQNEIWFVDVKNKNLQIAKKIKTSSPCTAITVSNGKLYAVVEETGRVIVLTTEGKKIKRIEKTMNKKTFSAPTDICTDAKLSRIYVLDDGKRQISVLSDDGEALEDIHIGGDVGLNGICRDTKRDRMFVVGNDRKMTFIYGSTVGLTTNLPARCGCEAFAVSYRQSDDALFVGYCGNQPEIIWLSDL